MNKQCYSVYKICALACPYCYTNMFKLPKVQMKCLPVIPFHCQAQKCWSWQKLWKCFDLKNIEISQHGAYNTETEHTLSPWRRVAEANCMEVPHHRKVVMLTQWTACWSAWTSLAFTECIQIFYIGRGTPNVLISQFYNIEFLIYRMLLGLKMPVISHFSLGRSREGGWLGGVCGGEGCARGGGSTLSPQFHSTVECVIPRALIPTVYLF